MEVKLFEVRDRGTTIAVLATKLGGRTAKEEAPIDHGGFGKTKEEQSSYVILTRLGPDCESEYDPYNWSGGRTLRLAHAYIRDNWDRWESGAVVDVEWLEEETEEPKKSEFEE